MKKTKILLTGATGFIGSSLVQPLINQNYAVDVMIRSTSNDDRLVKSSDLGIYQLGSRYENIEEILASSRPDLVIHMATLFIAEHQPSQVASLVEANITFPTLLIEAMNHLEIKKMINFGTSWQFFGGAEYSPVNLYAATKEAFEKILQFYIEANNFTVSTIYLSDTYGESDPRQKVIKFLVSSAINGQQTPLALSPGQQELDLLYIDDVIDGILKTAKCLLLDSVKPSHYKYQLTASKLISLRDLVREVEGMTNTRLSVEWGARNYRAREVMHPAKRYQPMTNWKPKIELKEGLERLILDRLHALKSK